MLKPEQPLGEQSGAGHGSTWIEDVGHLDMLPHGTRGPYLPY
ncbi:hypothetical protein [Streptomyces zaehneri]|nr:hypothetical protein [Streptomyces sp. DSM 40713]